MRRLRLFISENWLTVVVVGVSLGLFLALGRWIIDGQPQFRPVAQHRDLLTVVLIVPLSVVFVAALAGIEEYQQVSSTLAAVSVTTLLSVISVIPAALSGPGTPAYRFARAVVTILGITGAAMVLAAIRRFHVSERQKPLH